MTSTRHVEAELLDVLPADDPAAVRSRRDLRLLNAVMLHPGIMARRMFRHAVDTPRRIIELGAGDGSLMLRLGRRLARHWRSVAVDLVDQKDAVPSETRKAIAGLGWRENQVTQDVFEYLSNAESAHSADIVIANLFLHHFQPAQISEVFRRCTKLAPLFIALEPRRAIVPLLGSRLIWLLGCNHVSRHDAVASVRAGFRDRELSALWPKQQGWSLDERGVGLWTHCFVARKC
jgi:SAM-dependent methyltransferase